MRVPVTLIALLFANAALGGETISVERIKADIEYLASDKLQGRGPGTRGEEFTVDFLSGEFKKAGLAPAGENGTFFQSVPLLRVSTSPKSTLRAVQNDRVIDFRAGEDFSGTSQTQSPREQLDADVVFVGHGITAPEYGWDDYNGADVKGKVVLLFTNEPPSDAPQFFGGKALTYYGRWTFKFEEAARRGAKACFIIHTAETAGYPWSVVRLLEGAQLERAKDQPALSFAGWLSRDAGAHLLGLAGITVDAALKDADTRGFKAKPLGFKFQADIPTTIEKFSSRNVLGMIEGHDPVLKSEAVIFTAHWDHLGIGRVALGDSVYNGAADNATGTALLLELARVAAAMPEKPKRSMLFLSVTAEEKGLLGSKFYARHPVVPLGKTALNINFDMLLPLGVPESVVVTGAERTTAWPAIQVIAKKYHLEIETDQRAHLGIFYRSDHFSFARAGVPAFSVSSGMKIRGKPADFARKALQSFTDKAYHTPQDEVQTDWDYTGFSVLGQFALDVAREAADAGKMPAWHEKDEFSPKKTAHEGMVKVFILAGQSNMEGKAPNTLLDHQAADAKTSGQFTHLRENGKWIVRDDVFIKFFERKGPLTIGYGSPGRTGAELEFGTTMGNHFAEPVLLIKVAWGGHSLYRHFRSPSAGLPTSEVMNKELDQARDRAVKLNEKAKKNNPLPTMEDIRKEYGSSYRKMMNEVHGVMDDAASLFPDLKDRRLELAGFVWFQGWNDQYGTEAEYESNLKHFIRDVRKDLKSPKLPFVIAAMGQNGSKPATGAMRVIQNAQLAMNEVPEFRGNVKAIRTDLLVDTAAEDKFPKWKENAEQWKHIGGDFPYHYLGSAIWFNRIGKSMGDAMLELTRNP